MHEFCITFNFDILCRASREDFLNKERRLYLSFCTKKSIVKANENILARPFVYLLFHILIPQQHKKAVLVFPYLGFCESHIPVPPHSVCTGGRHSTYQSSTAWILVTCAAVHRMVCVFAWLYCSLLCKMP